MQWYGASARRLGLHQFSDAWVTAVLRDTLQRVSAVNSGTSTSARGSLSNTPYSRMGSAMMPMAFSCTWPARLHTFSRRPGTYRCSATAGLRNTLLRHTARSRGTATPPRISPSTSAAAAQVSDRSKEVRVPDCMAYHANVQRKQPELRSLIGRCSNASKASWSSHSEFRTFPLFTDCRDRRRVGRAQGDGGLWSFM